MATSGGPREHPSRVVFVNRPEYLYAQIEVGELDLDDARVIVHGIAAELSRSGHNKVLAVLDINRRLPVVERYRLMKYYPGLGLDRCAFAVVDLNPENVPYERFADAAAQAEGVQRQSFKTVEAAEAWLEGLEELGGH